MDKIYLDAIAREYSYIQNEVTREYEDKLRKIYKLNPKLDELTKKLSKLYSIKARCRLIGKDFKDEEKISELKNDIKKYIDINSIQFPSKFRCKFCKDTGYLSNGKKCSCYSQIFREAVYKEDPYYRILKNQNFGNLDILLYDDSIPSIYAPDGYTIRDTINHIEKFSRELVNNINEGKEVDFFNIMLIGEVGVGKSYISMAIANLFIDIQKYVKIITAPELSDVLNSFREEDTLKKEEIKTSPVLLIDDLGTELITPRYIPAFMDIINYRAIKNLPTIINSNLFVDKILEKYTERFLSKIRSNTRIFVVEGKDLRK